MQTKDVFSFLKNCKQGVVFGCEQLGGYEWGGVDVAKIEDAVLSALDHGIKIFDTADCYGKGLSEERLGAVLSKRRGEAVIASKYAVKLTSKGVCYDSSPEWARTSLEGSLKRLNTDYIDHYQMHYWDGETDLDDVVAGLEKFIEEGKIKSYGFTNVQSLPNHLVGSDHFQTMSLEFSLANRTHENAARDFSDSNYCFLAYGSLGQGILSGKYNKASKFDKADRRSRKEYGNFHGERFQKNLEIVGAMDEWSKQLEITIPKLALSWIRWAIPNAMPIIGIKNENQLKGVAGLNELDIPDSFFKELEGISKADSIKE